ncbi:MAG TPA: GNAT family N-acetyltransferase [Candidatus Eisenbacteria bacterium]
MTIRPIAESDLDRVHALSAQLGYPGDRDATLARIRAVIASPIADAFVAEDEGGRVLGWGHVFAAPFIESGPVAELGGLVVDEGSRGRGIGAALVARAEAWARERGLGQLCLRCNVIRAETHEFYRRLGFEIQKTQHKFRKAVP